MEVKQFYLDVLHITDMDLVDKLADISELVNFGKGQVIIKQGEKQNDFLFLVNGIFRGYYLDLNGKEITDCIGHKSGTPAMSTALTKTISPITIEAVTPCVLVRIKGDV